MKKKRNPCYSRAPLINFPLYHFFLFQLEVIKKGGGKLVPNACQSVLELIYDFVSNLCHIHCLHFYGMDGVLQESNINYAKKVEIPHFGQYYCEGALNHGKQWPAKEEGRNSVSYQKSTSQSLTLVPVRYCNYTAIMGFDPCPLMLMMEVN
ncbi:uncharacterized protein LOC121765004 [Salvia splendens]|uniref:uncharacterized protein LOC121765004 n=1 Tax=Salvia splendens TaxID=180675 RepID=UPI001C266B0A|nr:uncharacterized protein LOC121765004 [Salvia splendens]